MKLRSGKKYKFENTWWYKYSIEGCRGKKECEEDNSSLFMYNQHTLKEWVEKILPLYECENGINSLQNARFNSVDEKTLTE